MSLLAKDMTKQEVRLMLRLRDKPEHNLNEIDIGRARELVDAGYAEAVTRKTYRLTESGKRRYRSIRRRERLVGQKLKQERSEGRSIRSLADRYGESQYQIKQYIGIKERPQKRKSEVVENPDTTPPEVARFLSMRLNSNPVPLKTRF